MNSSLLDLLTKPQFRKGLTLELEFYSEDHTSKEQGEFQKGYVKHLRNNMKFKHDISAKAEDRLLGLAKDQKLGTINLL